MTKVRVVHQFYPVGQGLFVSGSVELWPPPPRRHRSIDVPGQSQPTPLGPYRWVYDCGSSTAKRLVTNGIGKVKADCGDERIDLLTLSHFHNDHISGVVELLKVVGAKTLMLPWAPLWHRLLIGFEQGLQANDDEILFFVDPVTYLTQVAGGRFDRILFVMPSEDEGPPFATDPIFPPPTPEEPEDRRKDDGPGVGASPYELDLSTNHDPWPVKKLQPGSSIAIYGIWEFVPYNDPATRPHDPLGFASIVEEHRKALLDGDDDARQDALRDLRQHYEAIFGRASQNDVSLMLYGGAIGPWRGQRVCECDCLYYRMIGVCGCWKEHEKRGAILLTGDGNLSTAQKWGSLERFLDARRARRTSVLQVAHHGARANWHDGLASLASPIASIFSSDPRHNYGHPHAEVLRDFWPYRAVQVDQHSGFIVHIYLER